MTTSAERYLKRWATKQLKQHACQCEDCRSARGVLLSIEKAVEKREKHGKNVRLRSARTTL